MNNDNSKWRARLKKVGLGIVAALATIAVVLTVTGWRAAQAVESEVAPLREAGKPTRLEDLAPESVADEENAFAGLQSLKEELEAAERELAKATSPESSEAERQSANVEAARRTGETSPNLIGDLRQFAARPHYQLPLNYEAPPSNFNGQLLSHLGTPRVAARVLRAHASLALQDGELEEAARDALAIYRWGEHVSRSPLLVSELVGMAIRGVALELAAEVLYANQGKNELPAELREQWVAELTDEAPLVQGYVDSLDSERAFGLSSYRQFPWAAMLVWNTSGDQRRYLEAIEKFQKLAQQPNGLADDQTEAAGLGSVWESILPSLKRSIVSLRRLQTRMRALRILDVWQRQHSPARVGLEEMDLDSEATGDPFNGQTLQIKPVDQTIMVYSVGENGVDDGGKLDEAQDVGVAPQ